MTTVRRNIWKLGTAQNPWHPVTLGYANGIKAMQGLPVTDTRSWTYQAAIHGTYRATRPSGAPWNNCQHASWYFLPWHRMYLWQFERIVRSFLPAADRATWSLPFWDYSNGAPGHALPPAFRAPTMPDGSSNPLFVARRRPSVNAGTPLPGVVTSTSAALGETAFTVSGLGASTGFGGPRTGFAHQGPAFGELEAQPHGPVHVQVGGGGGLMTDPNTAALDPIFWLHHANIDRLWEVWNIGGGPNPTVSAWSGRSFPLRNPAGQTERLRPSGVLDIVGQLDYTYEDLPIVAGVAPRRSVPAKRTRPMLIGSSEAPIQVEATGATTHLDVTPLPERAGLAADTSRVYLNLADIQGTRNPGVVYGVYLNLPPQAADADPDDEVRADHLAGLVSFFGIESTDPITAAATRTERHGMRYSFDVTDLVGRLRARAGWTPADLRVTLLPITPPEEVPPGDEDEGLAAGGAQAPRPPAGPVIVGTISLYQDEARKPR